MKKIFHILTILIIIISSAFTDIKAQEVAGGISIYPATVEIVEGESYVLTIRNDSDKQVDISVKPALFELDNENRTMKLLDQFNEIDIEELDLTQNITISETSFKINKEEEYEITIDYIKKLSDDTYLGVLISETKNGQTVIGVSSQIASVILDYDLTPEVLGQISNIVDISSDLFLVKLNLGNSMPISSTIRNGSTKLVEPAGEVVVSQGTTRLDSISLTQKFPNYIFPSEEVSIDSEFTDERPFWERVGFTTYTQVVKVNNKEISVSKDVLNLPWQILFLAVLGILILFILTRIRKRIKNKVQKPIAKSR